MHITAEDFAERFVGPESAGRRFVISELSYLLRSGPALIALALARTLSMYLAYRLSLIERCPLRNLKRRLSMNHRHRS